MPPAAVPALRREAEAAAEAQERRADDRAEPPSLRAQRQSLAAAEAPWDQARLERDGAAVVVLRAESGQLASLLAALQRASAPAVPADAALTERITLQQGGRTVAVLQMGEGDTVLWQSAAPGEPSRVMRPPASLLRALREELAQRLPR